MTITAGLLGALEGHENLINRPPKNEDQYENWNQQKLDDAKEKRINDLNDTLSDIAKIRSVAEQAARMWK
ncbi:hypothetical protein LCGC14_1624010 [marine sediment metagenome]|uniref:Uncharacterized protein n=1 Tax=marine sediment metagenome TaxID=412755 RepID=A0A0F9I4W0_9ZZZZ